MSQRSTKMTLERRGRLIFGLFILLMVIGCLWWPWWQMEQLVSSGDRDQGRALARLYHQNLHAVKFVSPGAADDAVQRAKARQLESFSRFKDEKPSRPIPIAPAVPGQGQAPPAGLDGFAAQAVKDFLKHPEQSSAWETSGGTFRYVQAFRAENECLACHGIGQRAYRAGEIIGAVSLELNFKQRDRMLLVYRLVMLAAALVVMVLSMAAFYAIFRTMVVRPIQHLKDVADRVSEGDLLVRSEIDTGNELESLSDAMNHMLDRMEKAQAELQAATQARDAKLDELAKANVALFEMNQVKNKFLTTMSHELRTPLNSILGFAQILADAPAIKADPKLGRYASNIQSSGRMLLEMINDLLDLAKIEAGRLQVRCEKTAPQDLAEVVCNMVRPMLAETPLKLTCEVDPATPLLLTDATKVQQILYNLLTNAIKFTAEGEVRLTVRTAADDTPDAPPRVAFAVSDTGPGIPRDEHLRIFERFTQLDSSYTRRYRGTGLGLSIVKELTGLLGGTVSVESEVGRGASFTVELPVDSSAAEARTANGPGGAEKPSADPEGRT